MKNIKKVASVLSTAALIAGLAAPLAANAAASYSVSTVKSVQAGQKANLGKVKVSFNPAELNNSDTLTLRLPSDFKFFGNNGVTVGNNVYASADNGAGIFSLGTGAAGAAYNAVNDLALEIPGASNYYKPASAQSIFSNVQLTNNNELKLTFNKVVAGIDNTQDTAYFYLDLNNAYVASGFSGAVNITTVGKSGSPFTSGTVTLANVGTGTSTTTIDSVKAITSATPTTTNVDTMHVVEDRPGAITTGQNIKYKLPSGFVWQYLNTGTNAIVAPVDGTDFSANVLTKDDGDVLSAFTVATTDAGRTLVLTATTPTSQSAANLALRNLVVAVNDDTVAKTGDVSVNVLGSATSSVGSFTIANYGDYGATVSTSDPKNVVAGRNGGDYGEIGKVTIQESAPGTLVNGRTVTLTLSDNAKWAVNAAGTLTDPPVFDAADSDAQGLSLTNWQVDGIDGHTIKATVNGVSTGASKAGKLVFYKSKVAVAADAAGSDINLTVGGTAGVQGTAGKVGTVVAPVTASIEGSPTDVIIGAQGQELPPIIVKENQAEAIDGSNGHNMLSLQFFQNEVPTLPTKVEVTDGDIQLDTGSMATSVSPDGRWMINIPVKSTSSKPSTIKFSGIKVTTDNTTPVGPMKVNIRGNALVENSGTSTVAAWSNTLATDASLFPGSGTVTGVVVANNVSSTPAVVRNSASFVIGSTDYKVNGSAAKMDAAPYINNGRTMLPVRFLAESLGATVGWDQDTQSVSILKDGRAISLQVGNQNMNVGGVNVVLDASPENKDGRVFLPYRAIAEALGAQVAWDATTQTVTLK